MLWIRKDFFGTGSEYLYYFRSRSGSCFGSCINAANSHTISKNHFRGTDFKKYEYFFLIVHFVEKLWILTACHSFRIRGYADLDTNWFFPDPVPDPAKSFGSDRIRIQNTVCKRMHDMTVVLIPVFRPQPPMISTRAIFPPWSKHGQLAATGSC